MCRVSELDLRFVRCAPMLSHVPSPKPSGSLVRWGPCVASLLSFSSIKWSVWVARVTEKTASVMAGEKLSKKFTRVLLNFFKCPRFL